MVNAHGEYVERSEPGSSRSSCNVHGGSGGSPSLCARERIQSSRPLELAVRCLRYRVIFLPPQSGQTCLETPVSPMTPPHIHSLFSTLFLPRPCSLGTAQLPSRAAGTVVTYWVSWSRWVLDFRRTGARDGGSRAGRSGRYVWEGKSSVVLSCKVLVVDLNSAVSTVRMLGR